MITAENNRARPHLHAILAAILALLFGLGLAACLPLAAAEPLPTETPTPPASPTETPTTTPVWFPPTPTWTPLPRAPVTPTVDVSPVYGAPLFSDSFTDPDGWSLGRLPAGSAAISAGELTLAIQVEKGYLTSLRQATDLDDFYLEITASPSICRGEDEYGLLLRAASEADFYRFALTCDGQARLDRSERGRSAALQPLTPSGAIPRGAPSRTRLAVWAVGDELRFYANDQHLFSVNDPTHPSGGLGVFAYAGGEDVVTVNFSELSVYEAGE